MFTRVLSRVLKIMTEETARKMVIKDHTIGKTKVGGIQETLFSVVLREFSLLTVGREALNKEKIRDRSDKKAKANPIL